MQIVRQAKIAEDKGQKFAVVFAAMGVKNDVADYFRRSFEESGVLERVVMFLNLSNDPIIERILTPRCALTAAEYLAFEHEHAHSGGHDRHDLLLPRRCGNSPPPRAKSPAERVIPATCTPTWPLCTSARASSRAPRASVTQIPILTMPNDDITHPVPDLTGYITEGQIVLDRSLDAVGHLSSCGRCCPPCPV